MGLRTAAREPLIDALRAWALLGVLVVNAVSYPFGPAGSPLGAPWPPDSALAHWASAGVAWWLQGKAYPMLSFLFGYSLALGLRGADAAQTAQRRRRQGRLLVLGVLHGGLLYAGDILSVYAPAAWLLIAVASRRLRLLTGLWRTAFAVAAVVLLLSVLLALREPLFGTTPEAGLPRYTEVHTWAGFVTLNALHFFSIWPLGLVLVLPEILMLMLAGLLAGRLRLLTHRRWAAWRHRWAQRLWGPAVLANLVYALLLTGTAAQGSPWHWVVLYAGPAVGWPLAAALLLRLAAAGSQPGHWVLAPRALGRYSLSVYVGHSLAAALVFGGAGWAWPAGTLGLLAWGLLVWAVCALLAHRVERAGFRGPLEAWMIRA